MTVMMGCGCAATGNDKDGNPICVVHIGLHPGWNTVVETPDLAGRYAKCCYGDHGKVKSTINLPFFEYKPDQEFDRYYCGCYGWD